MNKLVVISQRSDIKDFVDLYFLLKRLSLWDLIHGAKKKFNLEVNPFLLASDFLKIIDFIYLPRMILPVTLDELRIFYEKRAKELSE